MVGGDPPEWLDREWSGILLDEEEACCCLAAEEVERSRVRMFIVVLVVETDFERDLLFSFDVGRGVTGEEGAA